MSNRKRSIRKVLVISHGHPSYSLGGAEVASYNLFLGLNALSGVQAHYLARVDDRVQRHASSHLLSLRQGSREVLYHATDYDHVRMSNRDTGALNRDLLRYIADLEPDVVHFHHFLGLGLECLYAVKQRFPSMAVVVTFHEFLAICHQHGQMIKRDSHRLCYRSSPAECAMCFPELGRNEFFRRETFARGMLRLADMYVSPSRFLMQRYVDWGLPVERFAVIENGLAQGEVAPPRPLGRSKARNRFAFFGQVNPFKGLHVLLDAVARVPASVWGEDSQLSVFGGGLENQPPSFRDRFHALLTDVGDRARFFGQYDNAELGRLMRSVDWVVVPSVWWENSPVVIQEAFHHGRPVIASNIGGMAEKVTDGADGLSFRVGSAEDLADRLVEAISDPELWDRLRAGIGDTVSAPSCARKHLALYASALARARKRPAVAVVTSRSRARRYRDATMSSSQRMEP